MALLVIMFLISQFYGENSEAAGVYSYIPFVYQVPEGSVGVFRNGDRLYDEVYPAGIYSTWPSDEGFTIKITPQKELVTDIICVTVDGIKIRIPEIVVHYQINEDDILALLKKYSTKYVKPLIKIPVKEGIAELCSVMTAEAVYLEKFSIIKHAMTAHLLSVQEETESGLIIDRLEITRPRVPDEILDDFVRRALSNDACEPPYEIFHMLEDEKDVRLRLCSVDEGSAAGQKNNAHEGDPPMGELTSSISIANEETRPLPIASSVEEDMSYQDQQTEYPIQGNASSFVKQETLSKATFSKDSSCEPASNQSLQLNTDPGVAVTAGDMMNAVPENSPDNHLRPSRDQVGLEEDNTSQPEVFNKVEEEQLDAVLRVTQKNPDGVNEVEDLTPDSLQLISHETSIKPSIQSNGLIHADIEQSPLESVKVHWYQRMQDSKDLWKNNNGRLYLAM